MLRSGDYRREYKNAFKLYHLKNFEEALKILERLNDEYYDILYYYHNETYRLIGDIYAIKGKYEECIDCWEKTGIKEEEYYDRIGYLLFKENKYDESEVWFRESIIYHKKKREDKNIKLYYIGNACKKLGDIYLIKSEPEKALYFFKWAEEMEQKNIKTRLKKAFQLSGGKIKKDEIVKNIRIRNIPKNKEKKIENFFKKNIYPKCESSSERVLSWRDYWGIDPHRDTINQQSDDPYSRANKIQENVFKKYWNRECTNILRVTVQKWRWNSCWHIVDEVLKGLGKEKTQIMKEEIEKHNIEWNPNRLMYFCMRQAIKLGIKYDPPKIKYCIICGEKYFEADVGAFYDYPSKPLFYCPNCLSSALYSHNKKRKTREEMKDDLSKVTEMLGYIPSKDYVSKLSREKFIEVMPLLVEISPVEIYELEFGTWFNALIESNVLDDGSIRRIVGTTCVSKDGHECRSIAEKIIDDWFYNNNISHIIEPYYPYDEELNPNSNLRADWKVDNIFVEFFGLSGFRDYGEKVILKKKLVDKTNISLLEIYPDDLYNLDKKLSFLKQVERTYT